LVDVAAIGVMAVMVNRINHGTALFPFIKLCKINAAIQSAVIIFGMFAI
jgi:hypothetical protein